jgi:hypothetical protein
MRPPQYNLIELLLAILFVGLSAAVALMIWDEVIFIHAPVTAAILLFPTYLVAVLMIRHHR